MSCKRSGYFLRSLFLPQKYSQTSKGGGLFSVFSLLLEKQLKNAVYAAHYIEIILLRHISVRNVEDIHFLEYFPHKFPYTFFRAC